MSLMELVRNRELSAGGELFDYISYIIEELLELERFLFICLGSY